VRNNAIYGLGESVLWGGEVVVPHYSAILATISKQLGLETAPRVVDQIVGAVARFITADLTKVPVEEIVPVMLAHLPLREDLEEYELVFRCFQTLFSAGHALTLSCLPKMLECAAAFSVAHGVDKTKTTPLIAQLLKAMAGSFPQQLEAGVKLLPEEQQRLLAAVLQS